VSGAPQPAILSPVPASARFLTLGCAAGADLRAALRRVAELPIDGETIVGLGAPLLAAGGVEVEGLRAFPALAGPGVAFPSTQGAVWLAFGGSDPGETIHRARRALAMLGDGFFVEEDVLAFQHGGGRDLSGYEDGTENPKGERAAEVAIARGGTSFVAAQRWVHDLARLERMGADERDLVIGRHRASNEEIADAPSSAHVKRSAQESFDPPAFMLRRSMPYGSVSEHGLYFVAFGATLDPFERVLRRMAGLDDGVTDALMRFSRAVSGGYYVCPPLRDGRLDLASLGR
jgi:putative iron-dependent peroxidase